MKNKVAAIITNYNMPERTDALVCHIRENVSWPVDVIVVDNGSDIEQPSEYTDIQLPENIQTTGGWLAGLKQAEGYFAYWFLITSAEFIGGDPLTPMCEKLLADQNAVGVHPALTDESTTYWDHMKTTGVRGCRSVWMIDNIASLYRADWFDAIGQFDPALIYAWGIDLETCYKARKQSRGLYICEDVRVKKVTDIGYSMNRMNMGVNERQVKATRNMDDVFTRRYGSDWRKVMYAE